ncbi:hypothetical protein CRM91_03500 [Burkholderia ambifaria]|nr:hypothetical protein CRM91_03500 [Burkholderia ambifaria]
MSFAPNRPRVRFQPHRAQRRPGADVENHGRFVREFRRVYRKWLCHMRFDQVLYCTSLRAKCGQHKTVL